jgi:hypothetical protein
MKVEVSPLDSLSGSDLDQATSPTTIFSLATVAQTALIEMDQGDTTHSMT